MNLINTEFTLLIVDDEKQNRLLLTELFGTTYKIIQAKNGALQQIWKKTSVSAQSAVIISE